MDEKEKIFSIIIIMIKNIHSANYKYIENSEKVLGFIFLRVQSADLNSEIEGVVFTCQDGVMNTLVHHQQILKAATILCRLCKRQLKTLMHVLPACPSLAQSILLSVSTIFTKDIYTILTSHLFAD